MCIEAKNLQQKKKKKYFKKCVCGIEKNLKRMLTHM